MLWLLHFMFNIAYHNRLIYFMYHIHSDCYSDRQSRALGYMKHQISHRTGGEFGYLQHECWICRTTFTLIQTTLCLQLFLNYLNSKYSKSNRHLHLEANELVQTSMLTNFSLEGALNTTQNLQTHLGQTSIL